MVSMVVGRPKGLLEAGRRYRCFDTEPQARIGKYSDAVKPNRLAEKRSMCRIRRDGGIVRCADRSYEDRVRWYDLRVTHAICGKVLKEKRGCE